ncbi:MAG: type II secretion system protein, partial [bacterium]|nr:type II secretion system protein [bacterium]
MKKISKQAFTLAEVLITLAIIGVVAAISIPSVISNSQQQEFKTGLRKAVSVLNSAITMNMALDGETPYDNANLFGFLMRHMSVMKSVTDLSVVYKIRNSQENSYPFNSAFYTTDGMLFIFRRGSSQYKRPLHENSKISVCTKAVTGADIAYEPEGAFCGGCGSYGLNNNPDNTTKPPCLITVDVNGDRKP